MEVRDIVHVIGTQACPVNVQVHRITQKFPYTMIVRKVVSLKQIFIFEPSSRMRLHFSALHRLLSTIKKRHHAGASVPAESDTLFFFETLMTPLADPSGRDVKNNRSSAI